MTTLIQPYRKKPAGKVHLSPWSGQMFVGSPLLTLCGHDLKGAIMWRGESGEVNCEKCLGKGK